MPPVWSATTMLPESPIMKVRMARPAKPQPRATEI